MDSILLSVKKDCNVDASCDTFDDEIIRHTNSVLSALRQMGVGPTEGLRIEDDSAEWGDFVSQDNVDYEAVKSYVGLRVKMIFDPPDRSVVAEAIKNEIKELEWRLNFESESK